MTAMAHGNQTGMSCLESEQPQHRLVGTDGLKFLKLTTENIRHERITRALQTILSHQLENGSTTEG